MLALLVLLGCYASHERGSSDDAGRSSDAMTSADARPQRDGGQVPSCGPDTRPSELPAADRWADVDPALFDPGELPGSIDDPVFLENDPASGEGAPAIAAGDTSLAITWGGFFNVADVATMVPRTAQSIPVPVPSVRWAEGRFALTGGYGYFPARLAVASESKPVMNRFVEWTGQVPHPAWLECSRSWAVGYLRDEEGGVRLRFADEEGLGVGEEVAIADVAATSLRTVGLASRASVVWATTEGVRIASPGEEPLRILNVGPAHDGSIDAVRFRDHVVASVMDGTSVWLVVVDPWSRSVVTEALVIGTSGIGDRAPSIAAVEERGYLGVCWAEGRGPWGGSRFGDGVRFAMVTESGQVLGESILVATPETNIGGCAVTWTGEAFIVAWWRAGGDNVYNSILARRIVPSH